MAAANAIPVSTKSAISAMAAVGAIPDLQRELIGAVKLARDGTIPEYFNAAYVFFLFFLHAHVIFLKRIRNNVKILLLLKFTCNWILFFSFLFLEMH